MRGGVGEGDGERGCFTNEFEKVFRIQRRAVRIYKISENLIKDIF